MADKRGFFHGSTLAQSTPPSPTIAQCGACKLYQGCSSPKMPVGGQGGRRVLIVGDAPGANEDNTGKHFTGDSGALLRDALREFGIGMERDCWLTNTLICHPDAKPTTDQIDYCKPNLQKAIKELAPEIIIPLGQEACRAVFGDIWSEDVGTMARWAGWRIPAQKINAWVCPTYHPRQVLAAQKQPVLGLWWRKHLSAAFDLEGRPWDTVPDYNKQIDVIMDEDRACALIRKMVERGGPSAFDYECNMLKPEGKAAKILSCSICWRGKKTIAYPWTRKTREATGEYLRSPMPKIASNKKFEQRWTLQEFGFRVRNWAMCTMNMAHVCDNRRDITSIKFQSFVRIGVPVWNKHIEPYMQANSARDVNQILTQIKMEDLLLYNGLDSLFEYMVAELQEKEMQYEFFAKD